MNIRLFFDGYEFKHISPRYDEHIDSLLEDFSTKIGWSFFSLYVDRDHSLIVIKVIAEEKKNSDGYGSSYCIDHYNWHPARRSIEKTHETEFICDEPSISVIHYIRNETKTTEQSMKRLYQHDE